ncbi:MAG: hypothetical protein US50_C0004G0040 [Candidatus Nomurabacteria bacterium GW2011_GWB1_37_5]|uniref:Uncharacterized protein n=1 Tax=Candidatus Nomurabacteria bacterium GW2011_GWB1_37_5 TaxID=1618742 RepID=A0A0G0K5D4_9BACT|nr:MAG: hypothetical protein US50_C0004G0040 [Candidatus Nomurabacteria bacterium GW2011_GWB1_37_5]
MKNENEITIPTLLDEFMTEFSKMKSVKNHRDDLRKWKKLIQNKFQMAGVTTILDIVRCIRINTLKSLDDNLNFQLGDYPTFPETPKYWIEGSVLMSVTLPTTLEQYCFNEWLPEQLDKKIPYVQAVFTFNNKAKIFLQSQNNCPGKILLDVEPYKIIHQGPWDQTVLKLSNLEKEMIKKADELGIPKH